MQRLSKQEQRTEQRNDANCCFSSHYNSSEESSANVLNAHLTVVQNVRNREFHLQMRSY